MGREILYRGRRSDSGEWVEGFYHCCTDNYSPKNIHYITTFKKLDTGEVILTGQFAVDAEPVGLYTGMADKNGRKIFEGDICRNIRTGEFVSVKWHGTMAGFVWSKQKEKSHLYDFGELFRAYDKYEVIGNIYDNPELLEAE